MSQGTRRRTGRCIHLMLAACAAVALGVFAGCAGAPEPAQADEAPTANASPATNTGGVPDDVLREMRALTEKYKDVKAAEADGYIRDPLNYCVTSTFEGQPKQLGGMGIHYFRPDVLKITATEPRIDGAGTHTDFLRPGVLIYEPQADGSLALVAIENLVFQKAWHDAGHTAPPEFHGNQYYSMVDNPLTDVDEAHMFQPHYELHLWLYRDNPNGLFAQFNPNVTCEHHRGPAHGTHGD
ncbi:MAG TPA: hypothetical protein VF198_14355 [Vicinamibacterales bacterium]